MILVIQIILMNIEHPDIWWVLNEFFMKVNQNIICLGPTKMHISLTNFSLK